MGALHTGTTSSVLYGRSDTVSNLSIIILSLSTHPCFLFFCELNLFRLAVTCLNRYAHKVKTWLNLIVSMGEG